jgi:hypothetical protein
MKSLEPTPELKNPCYSGDRYFLPVTGNFYRSPVIFTVHNIHACLQYYLDCKAQAPSSISALIALPLWYRKKSWHKLVRHMHLVHHVSKAGSFSDAVAGTSHRSQLPWSYDLWYDPPDSPASLNFSLHQGDDALAMVFQGTV